MATLYEIAPQHRALADKLRGMGLDEDAVADTLEAESDLPGKVETYCIVIAEKEGDITAFKKEMERLEARIKVEDTAVKRMKKMLLDGLRASGEKRVQAGTFTVSVMGTKGSVVIKHPELLPREYLTSPPPIEPQPDKNLIYKAITEGHPVPGCEVVPGVRLGIK
jgi:hypothetical protein